MSSHPKMTGSLRYSTLVMLFTLVNTVCHSTQHNHLCAHNILTIAEFKMEAMTYHVNMTVHCGALKVEIYRAQECISYASTRNG